MWGHSKVQNLGNRCITGPILGRVFKIRELILYSTGKDLVNIRIRWFEMHEWSLPCPQQVHSSKPAVSEGQERRWLAQQKLCSTSFGKRGRQFLARASQPTAQLETQHVSLASHFTGDANFSGCRCSVQSEHP